LFASTTCVDDDPNHGNIHHNNVDDPNNVDDDPYRNVNNRYKR
jgi:hypothetical protein